MDQDFNQNIDQKKIMLALKKCYQKKAFSTFPYIIRNYNSKESIEKFNSGNCIALSMFLKKYLKKKHNVDSYLIPASIPRKFQHRDYLEISHVSLAIPKNKNKTYIADPAFYFLNPVKVRLNSNKSGRIFSKNIYEKETNTRPKDYTSIEKVIYQTKKLDNKLFLNKYQIIPKDTVYSKCYFDNDNTDSWNYYLTEILNPDEAISNFFSNIRFEPFIFTAELDQNGICSPKYNIKVERNNINVTYKNDIVENISFNKILKDPNQFKKKLEKYEVSGFLDDNLINGIIEYIKDINAHRKKINIKD